MLQKNSRAATAMNIGPVFEYGPIILWERTVQVALQDYCATGCAVLDVGANIGGVSIALSRMVGPSGRVYAFECNPRMLQWAADNLRVNGSGNVTLVDKAVYARSGEAISFYCEESVYGHGSSLVFKQPASNEVKVETITIDDYCRESHVYPAAIKIDVEGAEYAVLFGAKNTLHVAQPVVVFEDTGCDDVMRDPLTILLEAGYDMYDAATYECVDRAYYGMRPGVANILAIPPRMRSTVSYRREWVTTNQGGEGFRLSRGRYVLDCKLRGDGDEVAWIRAIDLATGLENVRYETRLQSLKHHTNSSLVLDLQDNTSIKIEVGAISEIAGLGIDRVDVYRVHSRR